MRVCCLSCVVVLFEGFVSLQNRVFITKRHTTLAEQQGVSVACFPPNNTLKNRAPLRAGRVSPVFPVIIFNSLLQDNVCFNRLLRDGCRLQSSTTARLRGGQLNGVLVQDLHKVNSRSVRPSSPGRAGAPARSQREPARASEQLQVQRRRRCPSRQWRHFGRRRAWQCCSWARLPARCDGGHLAGHENPQWEISPTND